MEMFSCYPGYYRFALLDNHPEDIFLGFIFLRTIEIEKYKEAQISNNSRWFQAGAAGPQRQDDIRADPSRRLRL